jgi:hypothetical protein
MQVYPDNASILVANTPEYPPTVAVEECDHVFIASVLD